MKCGQNIAINLQLHEIGNKNKNVFFNKNVLFFYECQFFRHLWPFKMILKIGNKKRKKTTDRKMSQNFESKFVFIFLFCFPWRIRFLILILMSKKCWISTKNESTGKRSKSVERKSQNCLKFQLLNNLNL